MVGERLKNTKTLIEQYDFYMGNSYLAQVAEVPLHWGQGKHRRR
jgi:hypothetical protein